MTYFGKCLLGQPILRQITAYWFLCNLRKEKKKRRRLSPNALIAIRDLEAHFTTNLSS